MKVLLGVTGSVASVLTPELTLRLQNVGNEVKIVPTEQSLYFWNIDKVASEIIFRDKDEWSSKNRRYVKNSSVLHIELREWADLLLIAPLSANTLAKLANGLADNLLTCVARAWEVDRKRIVVAPAMNTQMWNHPVTRDQLSQLKRWMGERFRVVQPIEKMLACGVRGGRCYGED